MRRRTFLSAIAGATIVGGLAVGAVAAQTPSAPTGYGSMHTTVITKAAARLGVTEAALTSALDQSHADALDDAVKAGYLTQQQADFMKAHHATMGTTGMGPGMHGAFGGAIGPAMHGAFGGAMDGFGGMMGGRGGQGWQGGPPAANPSR
ncbi:MAG: hypothetical protein EPO26_17250 [Chloroflexota bacterium]|nr:MAG: hypothetical protein EPO26_17250 [Chloroflexota bacterium]